MCIEGPERLNDWKNKKKTKKTKPVDLTLSNILVLGGESVGSVLGEVELGGGWIHE